MINRKVAIVSAYNYNFGTVLQATALVRVLSRYVENVTVLKYNKKFSFQQLKRISNHTLLKSKLKIIIKKFLLSIHTSNKNGFVRKIKNFICF